MDSPDLRPDREVLADVIERGTQVRHARQRRRRILGGSLAVIAIVAGGAVVAARMGDDSSEQVHTGSAAATTTSPDVSPAETGIDPRPIVSGKDLERPPKIRVSDGTKVIELAPWTTCWTGKGRSYCADGTPPLDLQQFDGADELFVEFPIDGWTFESSSTEPDGRTGCGRRYSQQLEELSPTVWRLSPMGLPGTYDVDVFGRGPGGDVIATFRWTTDAAGTYNDPSSSLSVLADHDGQVDSYGVEFSVNDLDRTPTEASATATITASNGRSHTIDLHPIGTQGGCATNEGNVAMWASSNEEGKAAAALGDPPFTYDVTLNLDGTTYEAHATWPDDVDEECEPCVPLTFTPPLPGLGN